MASSLTPLSPAIIQIHQRYYAVHGRWAPSTFQTLLNQQIAAGKEAVNEVGNKEDLPESVSCIW